MTRKSLPIAALTLALAVGISGTALAQDTKVEVGGKIQPAKLKKKKFSNVQLFASVGHDNADGSPGVPKATRAIRIDFGKNLKFNPNKPPKCKANLAGTTTQQARQLCSGKSIIGQGKAHVRLPGPNNVTDLTTLAIAGPGRNQIRFHAWSPTLTAANTQVIQGFIRPNAPGAQYTWRLDVPLVPDILGGTGANTLFGVTINRKSGVTQARCKVKKFLWRAHWTFKDDSTNSATRSQNCKRRR